MALLVVALPAFWPVLEVHTTIPFWYPFVLIISAARSLPIAVASCAVIGTAVGTFDTAGQSLRGDQEVLSYEEKRRRFFKQNPSSPPLSSPQ
jgi:hypothetical protein